jgi:Leucine-rich repeat (LRR) protein
MPDHEYTIHAYIEAPAKAGAEQHTLNHQLSSQIPLLTATQDMSAAPVSSMVKDISQDSPQESSNGLLQLPKAAFHQLLQKLDPRSLACTAVTCSQLNRAVLADISKVAVRCSKPDTITQLSTWLERHRTTLTNLTQCSVEGVLDNMMFLPDLDTLPCPQLSQLHLKDLYVEGSPGVLQDCTGLTALDLETCEVLDVSAAAAAITALSGLRSLRLTVREEEEDDSLLAELAGLPLQLTHLKLHADTMEPEEAGPLLQQLSRLVNLQHLELGRLPPDAVPDGMLSQLSKLTCLDINFDRGNHVAEKFRHLSSLTALQQLSVRSFGQTAGDFSVIERLSQLTSLYVKNTDRYFQTASTHMWVPKAGFLTALRSVMLTGCRLQVKALSSCTQLQELSLDCVQDWGGATVQELLVVVSQLSQLTVLGLQTKGLKLTQPPPAADAFTALTASSKLVKLFLRLGGEAPPDCTLFKPGAVHPKLRAAGLQWPCQPQIQQLCSCCPSLEILVCHLTSNFSNTALQPLLQLSALTRLDVSNVGAAVATVVNVAAQLTGLKHLQLDGLDCSYAGRAHPALLQLTALTRLQHLGIRGQNSTIARATFMCQMVDMILRNKVG